MRERWSKLSDSQLKIGTLPSGMTVVQPANARVLALNESTLTAERGKGLSERALEEAESACALLRNENGELKGLVVNSANAVCRILHKAVTADPDDLEFVRRLFVFVSFLSLKPTAPRVQPPPLATNDLFPLGSPDSAFERLSKLLTALQDALTTLKASAAPMSSDSHPKPQILLADLEKKVAESDAKAHKWEIEELQNTIAGLRDELSEPCLQSEDDRGAHFLRAEKLRAEKKPAPVSRVRTTKFSAVQDDIASHLPPTDEAEITLALASQHDMVQDNPEPEHIEQIATDSHVGHRRFPSSHVSSICAHWSKSLGTRNTTRRRQKYSPLH